MTERTPDHRSGSEQSVSQVDSGLRRSWRFSDRIASHPSNPTGKPQRAPLEPAAILAVADARALPLPDACVDLIVTSPPYALDIGYVGGDVQADRWPDFMAAWLAEASTLCRPRGPAPGSSPQKESLKPSTCRPATELARGLTLHSGSHG